MLKRNSAQKVSFLLWASTFVALDGWIWCFYLQLGPPFFHPYFAKSSVPTFKTSLSFWHAAQTRLKSYKVHEWCPLHLRLVLKMRLDNTSFSVNAHVQKWRVPLLHLCCLAMRPIAASPPHSDPPFLYCIGVLCLCHPQYCFPVGTDWKMMGSVGHPCSFGAAVLRILPQDGRYVATDPLQSLSQDSCTESLHKLQGCEMTNYKYQAPNLLPW